jgi:hypothetical protein
LLLALPLLSLHQLQHLLLLVLLRIVWLLPSDLLMILRTWYPIRTRRDELSEQSLNEFISQCGPRSQLTKRKLRMAKLMKTKLKNLWLKL